MFLLERACKIQIMAQSGGGELVPIDEKFFAQIPAQEAVVTQGLGGRLVWPGCCESWIGWALTSETKCRRISRATDLIRLCANSVQYESRDKRLIEESVKWLDQIYRTEVDNIHCFRPLNLISLREHSTYS